MRSHSDSKYSSTERKVRTVYLREQFGSLAIYGALLVPSILYGPAMAAGPLKTVLLTSPMIGFALMIWAIARHIGRIDEYQRMMLLETFALAAATTAAVTFTYGFMENAGYPRLSMFSVLGVMSVSWVSIGIFRYWGCRKMSR